MYQQPHQGYQQYQQYPQQPQQPQQQPPQQQQQQQQQTPERQWVSAGEYDYALKNLVNPSSQRVNGHSDDVLRCRN
jgi:hypothetical protein